jgi:hypothetical protein
MHGAESRSGIPWSRTIESGSYSLLEKRADSFVADWSHAIAPSGPTKPGDIVPFLTINKLPPGDYSLRLRTESGLEEMSIRVTDGQSVAGWVVGETRELQIRNGAPLNINAVRVMPDAIEVSLANSTPFARVHIVAERFCRQRRSSMNSPARAARLGVMSPARPPNLFAVDAKSATRRATFSSGAK